MTDSVLPFASGKLYQGEAPTLYALAAKLKIASYFNLGKQLDDWKRWLATNGPILTRLDVDVRLIRFGGQFDYAAILSSNSAGLT